MMPETRRRLIAIGCVLGLVSMYAPDVSHWLAIPFGLATGVVAFWPGRSATVLLVLLAALIGPPAYGQTTGSVLAIVVTDNEFKGGAMGNGFVVRADGTALTAAHVVRKAADDPAHTRVLALWTAPSGTREYFRAEVTCATQALGGSRTAPLQSRDVAVLRLSAVPADWPARWGFLEPRGDWTAHRETVPRFAPLLLAKHGPRSGDPVTMPGYVAGVPRLSETSGIVKQTHLGPDGTTLFEVRTRITRASSGSPIIGQSGVVGMWTWDSLTDETLGMGEDVEVLHHPCGAERL